MCCDYQVHGSLRAVSHPLWQEDDAEIYNVKEGWMLLGCGGHYICFAKCDALLGRAIQHDPWSRPMGDPALDKWEHD